MARIGFTQVFDLFDARCQNPAGGLFVGARHSVELGAGFCLTLGLVPGRPHRSTHRTSSDHRVRPCLVERHALFAFGFFGGFLRVPSGLIDPFRQSFGDVAVLAFNPLPTPAIEGVFKGGAVNVFKARVGDVVDARTVPDRGVYFVFLASRLFVFLAKLLEILVEAVAGNRSIHPHPNVHRHFAAKQST